MGMTSDERRQATIRETVAAASPPPSFYYTGSSYSLDTGVEYVPVDQRSVSRHLKAHGMSAEEIDREINRIQMHLSVAYAGPLAGHQRGLHESSGKKLLATSGPVIITPSRGKWPTLRSVIEGLLGGDPEVGNRQVQVFMAWLKIARESLVSGRRRPGQCLVHAGPPGSGKTLLIDITELCLGGRRANPYPYFSGSSKFNGDLVGAELLAVDDEAGSTDIRSRRNLAAAIKANLFSGAVRIEGKYRDGFTFRPCWRMVMACNNEPENLLVIPPLTEDIADKITLLRCHKRPLPMPAHTLDEREAFFATLKGEIPGMLHWLDSWQIPEDLIEERCGVVHFHHPELVRALGELAPETAMLSLVDALADAGNLALPWTGTAAELRNLLTAENSTRRDAERLLHWTQATGGYLGRLEGPRVQKLTQRKGNQIWRILPHAEEKD